MSQLPMSEAEAERILVEEIRSYARDRMSNIDRGAETGELAALLTDKVAWGMHLAARSLGYRLDNFIRVADDIVRRIDPDFVANRTRRWTCGPAGLATPSGPSTTEGPR